MEQAESEPGNEGENFIIPGLLNQPEDVMNIEVIEKKIDALDSHQSQMYEWGPWTNGREASVAKVPTGKKERRAWLSNRVKRNAGKMRDDRRATLEKWYGKDAADKAQFVESFEIAEYGFQPSPEEILAFFPMLKPIKP